MNRIPKNLISESNYKNISLKHLTNILQDSIGCTSGSTSKYYNMNLEEFSNIKSNNNFGKEFKNLLFFVKREKLYNWLSQRNAISSITILSYSYFEKLTYDLFNATDICYGRKIIANNIIDKIQNHKTNFILFDDYTLNTYIKYLENFDFKSDKFYKRLEKHNPKVLESKTYLKKRNLTKET